MSKNPVNNNIANTSENASNIYAEAPSLLPASLAECYKHAWSTLFNKLAKDEQAGILESCAMGDQIKDCPPNAQAFVRSVADLGEHFHTLKQKEAGNSKTVKAQRS